MDLKALQDWVVFKHLMSVPDVAAVSIFGGQTREYQVQVDPDKLVAYGLTHGAGRTGAGQPTTSTAAAASSRRASRPTTSALSA